MNFNWAIVSLVLHVWPYIFKGHHYCMLCFREQDLALYNTTTCKQNYGSGNTSLPKPLNLYDRMNVVHIYSSVGNSYNIILLGGTRPTCTWRAATSERVFKISARAIGDALHQVRGERSIIHCQASNQLSLSPGYP